MCLKVRHLCFEFLYSYTLSQETIAADYQIYLGYSFEKQFFFYYIAELFSECEVKTRYDKITVFKYFNKFQA